jgi:hypothetical protein
MAIDLPAAETFIYSSARLLDRHRAAVLLHGAPTRRVLEALAAYRNPDGGYGHALEPDARGPESETTAALHALEVLEEIDALGDPLGDVSGWVTLAAEADGGVPFVLATAASYPLAPWMVADGGSHLTFGIAALLGLSGDQSPWLAKATRWCWKQLETINDLDGYWLKFAFDFLDRTVETERAERVLATLAPLLRSDGSVAVPGGTAEESLTALTLSPRPTGRTRTLFTNKQITIGLDELTAAQHDDGGWTFDWDGWAPGQATEWRGLVTLRALQTLKTHGRLD